MINWELIIALTIFSFMLTEITEFAETVFKGKDDEND